MNSSTNIYQNLMLFFPALLAFLAAWLKIRTDIRNLTHELQESYHKSIFDKRIESYTKVWAITGNLTKSDLGPKFRISTKRIKEIFDELNVWYNSQGGFLLSDDSRSLFLNLRELCEEVGNLDHSNQSLLDEKFNEIWRLKMSFRISLRKDVFLEQELKDHPPEKWKFE